MKESRGEQTLVPKPGAKPRDTSTATPAAPAGPPRKSPSFLERIRDFIDPPELGPTEEVELEPPTLDIQVLPHSEAHAVPNVGQTLSDEGLGLLTRLEGAVLDPEQLREGERVHVPYNDIAGHATVGYGHLLHHGRLTPDEVDDTLTEAEARNLLREDVRRFELAVQNTVAVDINQNEFDALVIFSFNVGTGGLRRSGTVRELNTGNRQAAANELMRWNRATINGQRVEIPGLTARRRAERALFLRPPEPAEPEVDR